MSFQNNVDKLTTSVAGAAVAKAVMDNQILNQFQTAQNNQINAMNNYLDKEAKANEMETAINEEEKRLPMSTIESNLKTNQAMQEEKNLEYMSIDQALEEGNVPKDKEKEAMQRMTVLDNDVRGLQTAARNMQQSLAARQKAKDDFETFKEFTLKGAAEQWKTADVVMAKAEKKYNKRFGGSK